MVKELETAAALESIPRVTELVDELLDGAGCPARKRLQVDIAVDELFSNIARYAYDGADGGVRVRVEAEPGEARVTFADRGKPFDPLAREDPDVTLTAQERGIGGLGIFMVKKSMDEMRYERADGENRLTIVQRW